MIVHVQKPEEKQLVMFSLRFGNTEHSVNGVAGVSDDEFFPPYDNDEELASFIAGFVQYVAMQAGIEEFKGVTIRYIALLYPDGTIAVVDSDRLANMLGGGSGPKAIA